MIKKIKCIIKGHDLPDPAKDGWAVQSYSGVYYLSLNFYFKKYDEIERLKQLKCKRCHQIIKL